MTKHPGAMLGEFIRENDLTQDEVATRISCSRLSVNEIVNGRRNITLDMAFRLAALTGISAKQWLLLQLNYDLRHVPGKTIETARKIKLLGRGP